MPQLVSIAWASASTYRTSDKRGGANCARIRLAPQKDWEVNNPALVAEVLAKLEGVQAVFNVGGKDVSLADLGIGTLSNDFFANLLDMNTEWFATDHKNRFAGIDRKTRQPRWTASCVDLIFGSHSELRAQAEVYAQAGSNEKFANDFVRAWTKVVMLIEFKSRGRLELLAAD